MVREVHGKVIRNRIRDRITTNVLPNRRPNHNAKFQWNGRLINLAVILLTDRMREWQTEQVTDKPHWSHNPALAIELIKWILNCADTCTIVRCCWNRGSTSERSECSKPTFSTNPFHLRLLLPTGLPSWQWDWTGPITLIGLFLVSHFNFLFVPCGGLSWLPVNFLLHVKYTLSYRIVSYFVCTVTQPKV